MKIFKDLIISILSVICIALIVIVCFYNKISLNKTVSKVSKYELSEEMDEVIKETLIDSSTNKEENVIITYYIDSAELSKYEKTKEYDKGKKNPFSATQESSSSDIEEDITTSSSNNSTNFYKDDGTK